MVEKKICWFLSQLHNSRLHRLERGWRRWWLAQMRFHIWTFFWINWDSHWKGTQTPKMLRLKAFRPSNEKIVKIQLHPTHPWLVTADASDHVSVWNWEHRQVPLSSSSSFSTHPRTENRPWSFSYFLALSVDLWILRWSMSLKLVALMRGVWSVQSWRSLPRVNQVQI